MMEAMTSVHRRYESHPQSTPTRWLKFCILSLAGLYFATLLPTLVLRRADDNLYFHQAKAFLRGEAFVQIDPRFGDIAHYKGRDYVVFPPFPALLLTPLVWLLNDNFGSTAWVSLLLTGLAAVS